MAWLISEGRVLATAEVAGDRSSRRRGLLGRNRIEGALVLMPCRWVHTIGMRFDLDVAYLDKKGRVVRRCILKRHRVGMPVRQAHTVVEAERGAFDRWGLDEGVVIEIRHTEDEHQPEDVVKAT